MKKTFLIVVFYFITSSVMAQDISKNALGVRLFSGISYQRKISEGTRLEADLDFNFGNTKKIRLIGLHHWVFKIDKGFNWFIGAGAGVENWNQTHEKIKYNGTYFLLAGDSGIEYNFNFPLQIALNAQPSINLGSSNYENNSTDLSIDGYLALRYRF